MVHGNRFQTFKEIDDRRHQLRGEIFNYMKIGNTIERSLNAALKERDIPLYVKRELREEFTK
jgi:hypothetical protein